MFFIDRLTGESRVSNRKINPTKRMKTGFTLIELLVVIAIIAVLLSILMPAMRRVKEIARESACKSNLRSIGLAVQMYLDDYERKIPDTESANRHLWHGPDGVNYLQPGSNDSYWGLFYIDYLKETKIFGCPSLQRAPEGLIYEYATLPTKEAIQHAAFGLNHHERNRGRNTNDVHRISEFIFCTDHAEPRPECDTSDAFHNNDTPGAMNLTQYRSGARATQYRQIFRHSVRYSDPDRTGGKSNVLWLDGHVSDIEETTGDDVPLRWYTGD
jgi:prepilin-type N-terminal cleavage/methylation domain-containing protein/prepilin-type processing-associated H-X9-DG protein